MRRWRGGTGVLARGYYKGGFEAKMNRREAALILEVPYVPLFLPSSIHSMVGVWAFVGRLLIRMDI
jgi:hypothetical protein